MKIELILVLCCPTLEIIGDWVGQLGEMGEYWMGRRMSGLI
jgi:hypothetical protein